MNARLKSHLLKFASPSEEDLVSLSKVLRSIKVKKKDFLLRQGQICKYKYFVVSGFFRMYFINDKGIEKTINFGVEDWWLADFNSFGNQTKTHLFIQAVEDAEVLGVSRSDLDELLTKSLELNRYFRAVGERVRIADQRRIEYISDLSGKDLYRIFQSLNPDFVQRVPQYMLASYLGVTPEFLSKVRGLK